MAMPEGKKQYHVTLNEESTEKVIRILDVANQSLSNYMSTVIDEFAASLDESGFSKALDDGLENLKASDALFMMGRMLQGITKGGPKTTKGVLKGAKKK